MVEFGLEWLIGTALFLIMSWAGMLKLFLNQHLKGEEEKLKDIRQAINELRDIDRMHMQEVRNDYLTRREYESHRREIMRYLKAILQNVRHAD